ncbi:MAG: two-component sensor histidine kinase [Flavobacteriales bacterium]|nr:two-component sensor histidine kinase [Flavobacteriales bacterium]
MQNWLFKLQQKAPKGLVIYLLGFYVLAQFAWWAYMLVNLNAEIYQLKLELLSVTESIGPEFLIRKGELDEKLALRIWMVLGEGAVFVSILLLGFWSVRRSIAKELAVAEQQKNFLLSITHELKSPLAAIKLQLQTLQSRSLDEEKRSTIYKRALSDADRLEKLVESLLLVNKVESGGLPLEKKKFDLNNFVQGILRSAFVSEIDAGRIQLNTTENILVDADEMAMQIILTNLIGNAIKYGEGSAVEVSVLKDANAIKLEVSDEGSGIPDEDKQKVFERFYRRGNEDVRKTKGTGIGLYLVKLLVEKHGGRITVSDNHPKGTRFTVTLPQVSP